MEAGLAAALTLELAPPTTRLAEAYPAQLAEELVEALQLDGSGVLLDVGCGTGSLTLLLAHW